VEQDLVVGSGLQIYLEGSNICMMYAAIQIVVYGVVVQADYETVADIAGNCCTYFVESQDVAVDQEDC
jgi:hypothetical protein